MAVLDCTLIILMFCLGITSAVSDIKTGIIPNKLVAVFAVCALALDIVYYGLLARDVALIFILNIFVTAVISLCLYYSHALAGGDCKLVAVLSLLYPAGMYLNYGKNSITLFAALCFAIFFGYIYLLFSALWRLITGEIKMNINYVRTVVLTYLKSYVTATIYVIFVNLLFALIDKKVVTVNSWIVWASCIIIVWISGRISLLRIREIIIAMALIDTGLAVFLRLIPISLNPATYLFTAVLLLCQMTIRTNVYEQTSTLQVRKGMILSTVSSIAMQSSRIEGLPGISTEDLKSRLNEAEAESVRRWGKSARGLREIAIVKKIPFAIFIAMGYATYFILWGIVR